MLTTAALVNSEEDVRGYYNDEDVNMNIGNDTISPERHRENALQVQAAREMRRNLDVGGKRDASTMRTQATYLCSDFEMYATNKSTTFPLSGALQDKVGLRCPEQYGEYSEEVYVQHIAAALKLVPRPPIVMINHDKRFVASAHKILRQRENFIGYDAVGAYLATELRMRGAWWFMVHPSGAK
ncbi:hypothetical protein AK812_SmicGene37451 [Symbiodinium microadriaticum]|uniref:Uncharacterized protein n=1 Tax=Symbiodinium microadriaticum TaxID=2951 RepID=A0A1Q9CGF7_SYMMI|nr:hypothetical protein AK812_SmicGene37451 [Symbiodinium microadriaticum]